MPTENPRTPPDVIPLVPFGRNEYTHGGKKGSFDFAPADADTMIREFAERQRDLVIDYEHQTLSGDQAPAAGWIKTLTKTADGLAGDVKYWTDRGKSQLEAGEYRYFSPVLIFSKDGNRPVALHSVALTNHPALHGVAALVASDCNPAPGMVPAARTQKEITMTQTELALRALLGDTTLALSDTSDSAVATKLLALAEELPGLRAAAKENARLKTEAETNEKTLLLTDAIGKKKITNAAREAFAKLALSDLKDVLDKMPENSSGVPAEKLPEDKDAEKKAVLSDEEKDMAKKMNLTDEEFLAAKKAAEEQEEE